MAILAQSSRREMEEHHFSLWTLIAVPLLSVFLQAYLPLRFPHFGLLDLPVLVVIYFSVSRRSPIAGTFFGLIIGMIQDALTHLPFGIHGIINCILGYLAASIGLRIDVDNPGTRLMMNFAFVVLGSVLQVLIMRRLLGMHVQWFWLHELIRAIINALIGVILFALLDRLRQSE